MSFFPQFIWIRKTSSAMCLAIFTLFSMGSAQAVTIDFDDLDLADFSGQGCKPITNEYESLGVIFAGCVEPAAGSTKSGPNFIVGSTEGFSIYFTDTPPTYVSMYVGSLFELGVRVSAFGVNSYEERLTDGVLWGMSWYESTPYRPDQFVSFYMPDGISFLKIYSKIDPYIDDLTFIVDLPEPGVLILFCIGILGFISRRQKAMQIC
ncbi:MAG TPA: PEP-CTERM sorting domain-containing protein [Cellvibrio sp.]|nr:PEP-CTERM sorting domain-containing protein [Cellvibrio sp.]